MLYEMSCALVLQGLRQIGQQEMRHHVPGSTPQKAASLL
jgi:hypothetical protein